MSESLTNTQLKQRILGAGILVLLAAILIPLFLGDPKYVSDGEQGDPKSATFESKIQPLPGDGQGQENSAEPEQKQIEKNGGLVLKKLDNDPSRKAKTAATPPKEINIQPLNRKEATSNAAKVTSKPAPAPTKVEAAKPVAKAAPAPIPVKKTPPPKASQAAKPKPAIVTSGWVVQAGVFGKAKNATDLAAVLKSNGYAPKVSDVTGKPGIKKRVWIGPFASKNEAKAVSKKLEQQTGNGGYVAPYPFNS